MKIQILSDLHIEFADFIIDTKNVDVVVLAGDIHIKKNGVIWALNNIQHIPVIYVLGNHEYYGEKYPSLVTKLKELTKGSNIHVLEKDMLTIGNVNFLGCTLWTDFRLLGEPRLSAWECEQTLNDYRKIRQLPDYRKFTPATAVKAHHESLTWLKKSLDNNTGQVNVVVTHHAPNIKSLPQHKHQDYVSAAYASNLGDIIEKHKPDYWIHGHVHHSVDYTVGGCRIVCNPRGYPDKFKTKFNPTLTIEV
ncbi:Ser/Thr protein phosphatase family protein [hydrothermal vent metagenome]|uniref:Ser/Thr protein phosphatase family protein n=1 Tax=hydrothermal vent metagenome TaxID=652676 RepID=A0A3B0YFY4_9ZZZZ